MLPTIDLSQSLNNINLLTILFLFIPGYFVILFSNHLLKRNNKPQYILKEIDKWEFVLWLGIYSTLCFFTVTSLMTTINKFIPISNEITTLSLYLLSIVIWGGIDFHIRYRIQQSRSGTHSILQATNEKYSNKQSYVIVESRNNKMYRGLFLGIDYKNINKKFIKIGSSKLNNKEVPIKELTQNRILRGNSLLINLDDVITISFER